MIQIMINIGLMAFACGYFAEMTPKEAMPFMMVAALIGNLEGRIDAR